MAIKVTLRQKKIRKERKSLYLDFYPAITHPETGELTRREFLGLYIFEKPKNYIDKQYNDEQLQKAELIKNERYKQFNGNIELSELEKRTLEKDKKERELGEQSFIEYFTKLANKRKASNHDNWFSALNYIQDFTKGTLKFIDLNEKFLEDFKEYLLTTKSKKSDKTTLSQNSAVSYFNKVKATLKQAYKDGILQTDLNAKISPIKTTETRREYLTIEELNKLVKTPCNLDLLKRAALFSALTGLRFSDIQKMVWGELEYIEGQGYFLNFSQKKTNGIEYYPISEQAVSLLNEKGEPTTKVFEGLEYSAYHNKHLFQWIGAAGITKDITFHCFRHTFATLQLFNGTDIYTVSKMLGHKDLKTTQIYAKIVDDTKRKAADKIKLDM
jgi:integrase